MKTNSLSNTAEMMPGPSSMAPRRRRGGVLYLILWLLLASGALVYLGALALAPNELMAVLGTEKAPIAEANDVVAGPSTTVLAQDIDELRWQLEQIQGEVRTLVATNQGLNERLETIENANIKVQGEEASTLSVSQKKSKAAAEPEDGGITGVVIGDEGAGSEDIAADAPAEAPATKKSQKKASAEADEQVADSAPAEEQPKAEKRKFGLELAQSTSPEALQLNWDLLTERHKDLLKGLSARAQPNPNDPSSYRLVTGPFTSAQQAQSVCAKLKKQNVTCQVTGFGGENL